MDNNPDSCKSDLILEKLKTKGSDNPHAPEVIFKAVVFTLEGNRYAFKGENIKEILPFTKISFVPGCPDFIRGIINVRGDIESVVSISHILQIPVSDNTAKTRILIGENDDIRSGILVDSVEDVVDIDQTSIHYNSSDIAENIADYVVGEIELPEGCVTMLDIDKIFSEIAPRQPGVS